MYNEKQKFKTYTKEGITQNRCYKPFFVKDADTIKKMFPWQFQRNPQWLKEYLLLIKTRRRNKHYIVKGLSFVTKFSVKGFSKFKVIGWRELS